MPKKRKRLLDKILAKTTWRAGGMTWSVVYVERVDDEGSCGQCIEATHTLEIRSDLSSESKFKTLMHELGHTLGDTNETWTAWFELVAGVLLDNEFLDWKV